MNFIKAYKFPLSITLGLITVFFIFQNATCSNGSSSDSSTAATATGSSTGTLTITPSTVTIAPGGTQQFTTTGGSGTYTYSTIGGGTISQNGYFVAPTSGSLEVAVLDNSTQLYGYALVTVSTSTTTTTTTTDTTATVTLSSSALTVATGSTISLTATGGTSPYNFLVLSGGGGFPSVTSVSSATGAAIYTPPTSYTGSPVQIEVTDVYSNVSNIITVQTSGTSATTTSSTPKVISATASSQYTAPNVDLGVAKLYDKNTSTFYSSTKFSSTTPTTGSQPSVILHLGDSVTGTAGVFAINHVYITARTVNGGVLAFPSSYIIQARKVDGTGWTNLGTFTTQPDFDAVARVSFGSVTTDQIAIIAVTMGKDNNGDVYFQLAEIGF